METNYTVLFDLIDSLEEENPESFDDLKTRVEEKGVLSVLAEIDDILFKKFGGNLELIEEKDKLAFILPLWVIRHYCVTDNFRELRKWYSYQIDNDDSEEAKIKAAKLLRFLFKFIREKITLDEFLDLEFESIISGEAKSTGITKAIINRVKQKQPLSPAPQITGFKCDIHPDILKEIFNLMVEKEHLRGDSNDFLTIFSNTPKEFKKPVIWLILAPTGIRKNRGNQTALYMFIHTMLGKVSDADKRKAVYLFEDEKGQFFNGKMKKPNKYDFEKNNIFENLLKDAIKTTRPD